MKSAEQPTPAARVELRLILGVLLTLVWLAIAYTLVPMLWGQYATVFADAGPLLLSRGGFFMTFGVLPFLVLVLPAAYAANQPPCRAEQLAGVVIVGASILGYGAYLHNIVHIRGVDASLAHIAAEVGFENAEAVPAHIRRALELSDRLATENTEPWLPFAWRRVEWPAIPKPNPDLAKGQ